MKDHKRTTGWRWLAVIVSLLLSLAAWPAVASAEQKPAFPNAPKNSNFVAAVTAHPRGGKKAALTIHVSKKSTCSLSFEGPDGLKAGPVKGHFTKKGFGSWRWRVPHHVRKGTWTAKVRCQQGKAVRTLRAVLHVAGKSKKHVSIASARGFKFVPRTTAPAPNSETNWGKGAGGYPDANAADCSATFGIYSWCKGGTWLSPRGFAYRNCTDFVSWYMGIPRSKFGFPSGVGNAADWKAYAGRAGLAVSGSPSVGDIAWWGSSVAGGYGHVAIVTAVAGNGTVTIAEYNGDGRGNYGIRPNMRAQAYLHIPGGSSTSPGGGSGGSSSGVFQPVVGDFDGDGRDDLALRRVSTGTWHIWSIVNGGHVWSIDWPSGAGDDLQPVVGDFDGDGRDDLALRRISSGTWHFWSFVGAGHVWSLDWPTGKGNDLQPVVGDFDGDGRDDLALRRVSSGTWHIWSYVGAGHVWSIDWPSGAGGDLQPVVGDFNGDGRDDLGLRRISSGTWHFWSYVGAGNVWSADWSTGKGDDLQPVVGDFDGDGHDDLALRRVTSGTWHIWSYVGAGHVWSIDWPTGKG